MMGCGCCEVGGCGGLGGAGDFEPLLGPTGGTGGAARFVLGLGDDVSLSDAAEASSLEWKWLDLHGDPSGQLKPP